MKRLSRWLRVLAVSSIASLALVACHTDPRMDALDDAVNLMAGIVKSRVVFDAVHDADPQMRATTAADSALRGGVTANFPEPPKGIAIVEGDKPTQSWCVILIGDDAKKQVRIEGYAEDLKKPAITKNVDFPSK